MAHVVRVESSFNPYAIGVVGGRLERQPRSLPEALATARMLEREGYNFSLGLAQVNRHNLARYGLDSYVRAFEPCANLQAGARILADCHRRARGDWGKAFSCYYSGNFVTGYRHGYVQKIFASMRRSAGSSDAGTGATTADSGRRRMMAVAAARSDRAPSGLPVAAHPATSSRREEIAAPRPGGVAAVESGGSGIPATVPTAGIAVPTASLTGGAAGSRSPSPSHEPVPASGPANPEPQRDAAFVF